MKSGDHDNAGTSKKRTLRVLGDPLALFAEWPEAALALSPRERKERVRRGSETVLLREPGGTTRGFVRAVLRVPLGHEKAQVYGVFVEVDRAAYEALQQAYRDKEPVQVRARLANVLPHLEDAYDCALTVEEDGSKLRARVVAAEHSLITQGPRVGP